jgi:4-hydroxy-4-methyl-2-oxoglutarate aldolase
VLSVNTAIKVDGVRVRPGDILVGDGTGIACAPYEVAEEVMNVAKELDQQDKQAIEEIRGGLSFTEALRKFSTM